MPAITLIAPTNNLEKFKSFLDNVKETLYEKEYKEIEIITKFAREQEELIQFLERKEHLSYPFKIKIMVVDKRNGYFSLGDFDNRMIMYSDEDCYFISILSIDVRFQYKGWVSYILKYKDKYKDGIFVIKTTKNRNNSYITKKKITRFPNNYYPIENIDTKETVYLSKQDIVYLPDNFPFYTKKFLCMSSGIGDIHGPDSWFEHIIQILKYRYNLDRSIILGFALFNSASTKANTSRPKEDRTKINEEQLKIQTDTYYKYNYEIIAQEMYDYITKFGGKGEH